MKAVCAILLGLVAIVAAHYEGYPFVHKNEGRYGAKYPYANYNDKVYKLRPGQYGPFSGGNSGSLEFKYRQYGGIPVHVGNGKFYFLGNFAGDCNKAQNYGFYFTGDATSYIVCDHGKPHRFKCPAGTKNPDFSYFTLEKAYNMNKLCGVRTFKTTN